MQLPARQLASPLVSDWERSSTAAQVVAAVAAGGLSTASSRGRGGLHAFNHPSTAVVREFVVR